MQSALLIDSIFSLKGPDGITRPLPIHCLELKHSIEISFLIEKSCLIVHIYHLMKFEVGLIDKRREKVVAKDVGCEL